MFSGHVAENSGESSGNSWATRKTLVTLRLHRRVGASTDHGAQNQVSPKRLHRVVGVSFQGPPLQLAFFHDVHQLTLWYEQHGLRVVASMVVLQALASVPHLPGC